MGNRSTFLFGAALGGAVLASAGAAFASEAVASGEESVIYSNLRPDGLCRGDVGSWNESGADVLAGPQVEAFSIVPTADFVFTKLIISLMYFSNHAKGHFFRIYIADTESHHPGRYLDEVRTDQIQPYAGRPCPLETLTFSGGVKLHKGRRYWIVTLPGKDVWGGWWQATGYGESKYSESGDEGRHWSLPSFTRSPGSMAVYGIKVQ